MRKSQRRGAALILGVILMFTLVSMLAFSIDIGCLASAKAEMRRNADSAALAGAWHMLDRLVAGDTDEQAKAAMRSTAAYAVSLNKVCNQTMFVQTAGESSKVQDGYLANLSGSASLSNDSSLAYRAVKVQVQKTSTVNGYVPFYFGRIFGETGREVTVSATAAMSTRIKGFNSPPNNGSNLDLLPFALDLQTWNQMLAGGGSDSYRYNDGAGTVTSGSDGYREMNLYPQGTGSPGNRGTVDIGGANNSTADIARQIVSGISAEDLAELGKPLTLDNNGVMTLNGDTGISAGVKDELASIIGETRIIPIFSTVSGNGNNATYTIVKWVGVRILDVKLTGSMSSKKLTIQPAAKIARNAVIADSGSTSDFVYSPVVLVQ